MAQTPEERAAYMRDYYRRNADRIRTRVKAYREKNIEKVRQYDRDRGFRLYNPDRLVAHNKARVLPKGRCEVCGAPGEKHHDDYSKPLEVRYLCKTHHAEHHRRIA